MLTDNTNVVEVYLCPHDVHDKSNIKVGWKQPLGISTMFGNGVKQELKEYHHRDMTYVYDLANDGQRAMRRLGQKDVCNGNMYAISFMEETIPTHRFPSTKEIVHEEVIVRTSFRINNRMHVVHDNIENVHHYFIRYQHSDNVDIKKMVHDFNRALGMLRKVRVVQ